MTDILYIIKQTSLLLSVGIFVFGLIYTFCVKKNNNFSLKIRRLTIFTIMAIMFIVLYENISPSGVYPVGVIGRTMQAFSLDVDYERIFDSQNTNIALLWYKAILFTLAPALGGAVIYDVLAGVSPYVILFFHKTGMLYIFSELNSKSLCIAENIVKEKKWRIKPVLVFTNCIQDNMEEETGSELWLKAKELQAICLPDSLSNRMKFRWAKGCHFFLMNCDSKGNFIEEENLDILQSLLSDPLPIWPIKRGCHFFCFSDHSRTIENIRASKAAYEQKNGDRNIVIHIVRDQVQSACFLMNEYPLYTGLIQKHVGDPLQVLIVGNNSLSHEIFKTVFWCGQLLDHPLRIINAYESDNTKGNSREWIYKMSPELFNSCIPGSECLKYSLENDYADPYASLCFVEEKREDFYKEDFLTKSRFFQYGGEQETKICYSDYIIIATGNDNQNMELADTLWRELFYQKRKDITIGRVVIIVIIEDERLSEIMELHCNTLLNQDKDIIIVPFGTIKERYSLDNIFSDGFNLDGKMRDWSAEAALHSLEGMDASNDDFYSMWSSSARQVHLPYKMFSVLRNNNSFQKENKTIEDEIQNKIEYTNLIKRDRTIAERLTWLEHRRWNAFMRTEGFRTPPFQEAKLRELKEGCLDSNWESLSLYAYKNIPARLHPNLVESYCCEKEGKVDLLDLSSSMRNYVDRLKGKQQITANVKVYDEPFGCYGPDFNKQEVCVYLKGQEFMNKYFNINVAWNQLETDFPEIKGCENPKHPGFYMVESVLKIRTNTI